MLLKTKTMHIEAVIDKNPEAPGLFIAQKNDIETALDWAPYITEQIDIIIETTGDAGVLKQLMRKSTTVRSWCRDRSLISSLS